MLRKLCWSACFGDGSRTSCLIEFIRTVRGLVVFGVSVDTRIFFLWERSVIVLNNGEWLGFVL